MRRPASGEWALPAQGFAGPRRGTWRDHEADVGGGVEGLADALALAARLPWRAVCISRTAEFHRPELARWLA